MYKKAVRQRSAQEEIEDITSRISETSTGHGARHPLVEIELFQRVKAEPAMPGSVSIVPSQDLPDIDLNTAEGTPATLVSDNVIVHLPSESEEVNVHIV